MLADNFHEQMRESWVYLYDAYQRYPFQGNLFGLPPAVVKECLLGVIEASRNAPPALAAAVGNGNGNGNGNGHAAPPANFLEWSHRTFGAGITRHFMQPYNFKVWGIDPARMSSDWIAGRVLTPSLDEVIEGSLQRGRPDMGPNARFGYPLHGGCEMFVAGLAKRAFGRGGACTTGRTLVKVDPKRRRATFRVERAGEPLGPAGDGRLRDALPEHPAARPDRGHRRGARGGPPGGGEPAVDGGGLRQPGDQPREGDGEALDLLPRGAGQVHLPAHLRAVQRLAVHGAGGLQRPDVRDQPLEVQAAAGARQAGA